MLDNFLFTKSSKYLAIDDKSENYNEWDMRSRRTQIAVISCLTASLYVIFILINKTFWVSTEIEALMVQLHSAIVIFLLLIAITALNTQFYKLIQIGLLAASVAAATIHSYIIGKLPDASPLVVEGYMIVFWTFMVSGMIFRYSLPSAIICSLILLGSAFFHMNEAQLYSMHLFWLFCVFSFGLIGALMLDKNRRNLFESMLELQNIAVTDHLTGAFNRNQLDNVFAQKVTLFDSEENTFGFLIIDIDSFKKINDDYGHIAGDMTLKSVAKLISTSIGEADTLFRWGGEEFVVITAAETEQDLFEFCEKIRTLIESHTFSIDARVTVSIGATIFRREDTQAMVLARADKALYFAKGKQRNISVCH